MEEERAMNQPPPIGKNIHTRRKEKGMSLEMLSKRSGVSKSMLSQIEQEKTNPTVVTAWKIARALSMTVQELMENREGSMIVVTRHNDAPMTTTPDNLCTLRVYSPMDNTGNVEIYFLHMEAGGVNDSAGHSPNAEEFLSVLTGQIRIKVGEHEEVLKVGDTARYNADIRHIISNEGNRIAEAILIVNLPRSSTRG